MYTFYLLILPTESSTVSHFFNAYCMTMYSSNLWRFNSGRNCLEKIYKTKKKIRWKTHNKLLHHINNCLEILLARRCIKFINGIINSEHSLHSRIALYNCKIITGDYIRYLMYKYRMSYKDWYSPLYNIISIYLRICIKLLLYFTLLYGFNY